MKLPSGGSGGLGGGLGGGGGDGGGLGINIPFSAAPNASTLFANTPTITSTTTHSHISNPAPFRFIITAKFFPFPFLLVFRFTAASPSASSASIHGDDVEQQADDDGGGRASLISLPASSDCKKMAPRSFSLSFLLFKKAPLLVHTQVFLPVVLSPFQTIPFHSVQPLSLSLSLFHSLPAVFVLETRSSQRAACFCGRLDLDLPPSPADQKICVCLVRHQSGPRERERENPLLQ